MAYAKNNMQQIALNDSAANLSERAKRFLKKSWAEAFAEHIFPRINEERFAVLFSDNLASRPNTPVNVIIGMLILKEMNDHTEDDLLEAVLFDIRYQYALHTTSFTEQPVSDRTLSRFRERLYTYEHETGIDLLKEEMEALAQTFVETMGISGRTKRMDSLMVASSSKWMSRLELFYSCVSRMVKAIQATGGIEFLDKRLRKYLDKDDENNTLYRARGEEVGIRLEEALADALRLLDLTGDNYEGLREYQQLKRLIEEQTLVTAEGRKLLDGKELGPNSLQNPSDEDATYREKGHTKNKGYVGNFVETFDKNGAIITGMDYAPNVHSDSTFSRAVIEAEGKPEQTVTLIADGDYGSDELMDLAEQNNVKLVTTTLIGKAPDPILSEYEIDEKKQVIVRCPAGHAPISCQYKAQTDSYYAHFNKGACERCPLRQRCGVKFQKKTGLAHIYGKTIRRAEYLKKLSTTEYQKLARQRNAVEGIPSVLRRKYVVDQMPVRGYVRSKTWYYLKLSAINAKRVAKWTADRVISAVFHGFSVCTVFFCPKNRFGCLQLKLLVA